MTIVVGAGISVPAPTGAPDFRALRDRFLSLADPSLDPNQFKLDQLSPEQVFESLDDQREESRAAVRRELWWLCEPNEPNANHYAVAAIATAGARVWTPNFDTMIERAAGRMFKTLEVLTPPDVPGRGLHYPHLLKVHGSFPFPGDPPREPVSHDYRLLFEVSDVWLMNAEWTDRLKHDIGGRDVCLFGYRGADPDLTPALLEAFELAASVKWWEFAGTDNFDRLGKMLAPIAGAQVIPGDPSAALQTLAQSATPHRVPGPTGIRATRPVGEPEPHLTHLARAQLLGQFRGASAARAQLRRAILRDPEPNRGKARYRLLRSIGYDIPLARSVLVNTLNVLLATPPLKDHPGLSELYAMFLDARPIRPADERALKRLLAGPGATRAEILVRVASVEKLHGHLAAAAEHARLALDDSRRRPNPRLEAMATYNLAWTYRQRADFAARHQLVEMFAERIPHIGFNWAGWLAQENVLAALNQGDLAGAQEGWESPFLNYSRSLIGQEMYGLDDTFNQAILRWHEKDASEGYEILSRLLAKYPLDRDRWPPFTLIDAQIALADAARALGDRRAVERRLAQAEEKACSLLQRAKIRLVRLVTVGESSDLRAFERRAAAQGFGLIAATAEAVLHHHGRSLPGNPAVFYQPQLPLAGIY
jgi:hypothetical protein